VNIQKIPDGYPLQDFFGSVVQIVRDEPGVADTIVVRNTQLQDLDARELFFEAPDPGGEIIRSTTWITVSGPLAYTFNFKAPIAHAAEIEPVFKALVQSVIIVPSNHAPFEALRTSAMKSLAPGPIHERESIVESLTGIQVDRRSVLTRLAALFSSHADVAVDLLLDRRPLVRMAAVEALASANTYSLRPFLWQMVDDAEPLVAEAAARAVAKTPDVINKTLEHSLSGLRAETVARVWAFMARDKRNELLHKLFSESAVPRPSPPLGIKGKVTVAVDQLTPVKPGTVPRDAIVDQRVSTDPHVQMWSLTLLRDVTPDEFKLPLARIVDSKHNPLIAVGLQVANDRRESLAVDALLKLAASSDAKVSKLAVQNLALSAGVSDIPRIEALTSTEAGNSKKPLDDELKLTIKKIRFRHELAASKGPNQAREIITKALSDPSIAGFAWLYDCEATVSGCAPATSETAMKPELNVKPFGENFLPKKLQHYAAIPKPGEAVKKFSETLEGVQLDSPRAQSNLVLTMGYMRQTLAQQLSAPAGASALIHYSGIDPDSPIAVAAWTASGASDNTPGAQRSAVILRVKDRSRLERAVHRFQETGGSIMDLTNGIAVGTRAMAALPALLALSAQKALTVDTSKPKTSTNLRFSFIGEKEWNGLRIKTIEQRQFDSDWLIEATSTHMVFIGDTVVLTSDLATLRELLGRQPERQYLSENPEFQKAIQRSGDVVYFSDLKAVMAEALKGSNGPISQFNESGSLKFSNASWENFHYLEFDESDWAKPFLQFEPKDLSAPRDLLPASTIAYFLARIELSNVSASSWKPLLSSIEPLAKLLSLDVKHAVSELGPECGAAMLELPDLSTMSGGTWAVFCKLKSNKLAEKLKTGTLFSGVGPVNDVAEVKVGDDSYFVAIRNGFLVVSNQSKALSAFDAKTSLATTRDYLRAVEKVPSGIVAFGGYNLEATITAGNATKVESERAHAANVLFSVASAFHSQKFYAIVTAGSVEAQSSVAMDREGRYPLADLSYLPHTNITLATLEPRGVPITDQQRVTTLALKIRAKARGPIDNIKDDIRTADQLVEQKAANELLLTVAARRPGAEKAIELPVKDAALAEYLKATSEFPADNKEIMNKAREIAGNDKDAWSVARKLADWTYKNLEWKHVLNTSAAQTLATREADCSEFSQLFVAMARSLGLPARTVLGLAYSGSSFGGHAWVEVWAGRWIELDPTWGTHFVDATHIRNASNTLLTSAALNLIELEVLDMKRTVADFQKSPRALAEHLMQVIPSGAQSELEAAVDLPMLTDDLMGEGAWSRMTAYERDQLWTTYRRTIFEIVAGYSKGDSGSTQIRLLHTQEEGNKAEAIYIQPSTDTLIKLRLVRRDGAWYLAELVQSDSGLHLFSEMFRPVITRIESGRAGGKVPSVALSDFLRALFLFETNSAKAVEIVDNALKVKPSDKRLRYLKALALLGMENRTDESVKLLRELSNEAFAPALLKLATHLRFIEDEKEIKNAIELYERYTSLEPHDPRGFTSLAYLYDRFEECSKAEAAHRKSIAIDPGETTSYSNFIEFLILHDRISEVKPVLMAADKHRQPDEDLFGWVVQSLYDGEQNELAQKFLTSEPSRAKTSYLANYTLGKIHLDAKRYPAALRSFEVAAQLDNEASGPHVLMAVVHRKQLRWAAALKAAQRAIDLDPEDSEAYYQRACALARLGRIKEAMTALEKSIQIDSSQAEWLTEEIDFKPLRSLPSFKKLIPKASGDNK
jgi:transglutaminase-like putative cysteine protease/Flp pilus assembly protein TadD